MTKKILYIGNDLAQKEEYHSAMATLSGLLISSNFDLVKSSNKKNKFLRLLAMCWAVFIYRNKVTYILIDTYSTTNFYYAFCTSVLARFYKIKYIPILHGGNLPFRLDKSKKMAQTIFKYSYKNVAPSMYLKTEFEKRGYRVSYIPNILEIDKYQYKKRAIILPKLLWVRAFKSLYNPTMAIEVLQLLKEYYPDAKLCMVGPEKDNSLAVVKALVAQYKLEDSVEITGGLPKEVWHKKSKDFDIFINTTNIDNTPVSVMEAMALGLTVVSTQVGGIPFLIDVGIDGVLVEKENPKAMTDKIVMLIKTNNQQMAINARKKAESFGWDVVKLKWINLLE